ncbi:hypothetical protein FVF58_26915 [Paraburkholderia panacisoli]|uniref:Uncharacterized protein n=1 Tax=Paraburkholderia panacisoli TaxID=2603818 RepID=A0A5B0GTQ6_9BURK|nr:hypothetical protein [Paraburkholderia panacisoli]KAA1006212.1 hypothetical protein FVF58_26915 [Paraburkholderia panacisoli]
MDFSVCWPTTQTQFGSLNGHLNCDLRLTEKAGGVNGYLGTSTEPNHQVAKAGGRNPPEEECLLIANIKALLAEHGLTTEAVDSYTGAAKGTLEKFCTAPVSEC